MSKSSKTTVRHWLHTRNVPVEGEPEGWTAYWDYTQEYENSVTHSGPIADFRGKIARKESATSYLDGVEHRCWEGTTDRIFIQRYVTDLPFIIGGIETRGGLGSLSYDPAIPSDALVPSVQSQCKTRIINQIRSANESLKGLVSAGEFGETVRFVNGTGREVFRRLWPYLHDLEKIGRTVTPQNLLRSISRRWLEYSFGVRPLIADIDDAFKALGRLATERQPRLLVRTSSSSLENHPVIETVYNANDYEIKVLTRRQSLYGCRIYGCVSIDQGVDRWQSEFGFKLDEFVPTLWELIPFSFLADYFINVGAVIDAYALNTSGVRWLAMGEFSSNNLENEVIPTFQPLSGWTYNQNSILLGKPTTKRSIVKSRKPISTADLMPSLRFKIPGSSTQWLNIAALSAQLSTTSRNLRGIRR